MTLTYDFNCWLSKIVQSAYYVAYQNLTGLGRIIPECGLSGCIQGGQEN